MAITKRLKNNSGADKFIITRVISNGAYYDVEYKYWVQVLDDADIIADVASGQLIVNDGANDLSASSGQLLLERFQSDDLFTKHKRIIAVSRNGNSNNSWLRPHDGVNSDKSYWLAEKDYNVIGVKFSNAKNGSSGNPTVVRISCYSQAASASGNISTSDTLEWWVQAGDGSADINGYRGRSWFYDNSSEGDTLATGNVYAFRIQKISGSNDVSDPTIEIFLEEI